MPVSYLPSAALLVRPQGARPALAPWRRQIAAFGDPAVDARGALTGDESWSRLPEAGRELHGVVRALPGRASIYQGPENLKRRLTGDESNGVAVLHFATHATVDATDSNRSRILFTPEPGSQGSEYLFRGEAQNLKLEGVDLVTVSACDTEAGRLARGEGVQSFSRSFLAAGARATVTTLWRVEDRATADFMQLFYRQLGEGAAKAEALRTAKLDFIKRGALPRDWSAFVLNGDGDTPLTPVLPWSRVLGSAGVLAALVTAFYRFRRRS
jgi:CHAT domain-containing protein